MTWRPGPAISGGACFPDYDETDPWTQRFISKADDGKLSLDVQVKTRHSRSSKAYKMKLLFYMIFHWAHEGFPSHIRTTVLGGIAMDSSCH